MSRPPFRPAALVALLLALAGCAAPGRGTAGGTRPVPPAPDVAREFRGVWVATVANIDWPSRPGLPVAQQQAELVRILDRAHELNLNAIVFQVRPATDALYESKLEPWSSTSPGAWGRRPSRRGTRSPSRCASRTRAAWSSTPGSTRTGRARGGEVAGRRSRT
jgi:uncharacterized lipoprotein YddW (UPF0748 family)